MRHVSTAQAYLLADWAVRVAAPATLEYDDGRRRTFPKEAARLRGLREIKDRHSAEAAQAEVSQEIMPPIFQYRDGHHGILLRQAAWLCTAASLIERGLCPSVDYGSERIIDVMEYMRIPTEGVLRG